MFGKIFNLYRSKCTQTNIQINFSKVYAFYFESHHERSGKMKASCRRSYCTFYFRKNSLVHFFVFRNSITLQVFWNRRVTQFIYDIFKLLIRAIKKETYSSSSTCSIVNNLSNKLVLTEEQLIPYSYFSSWIN